MLKKKVLVSLAVLTLGQHAYADQLKSKVYGYIEGYVEKNEKTPTRSGGDATTPGTMKREDAPHEFDTPNIVLMVKSTYKENYSAFLNLVSPGGEEVKTRNAWVESRLQGEKLKFRIGKLYRPFGLYNEILDAVPTFMGIEPPELFDNDHLLLTRTTNSMIHGETEFGADVLRYSLTTGNDEKSNKGLPIGADLRYTHFGNGFDVTLGSSYYTSGGKAEPSVDVGDGAPAGGVANWMKSSKYDVKGIFAEVNKSKLKVQAEYWISQHDDMRDGSKLQNFGSDSALNQRQLNRLCNGNCSTATDSKSKYNIETWYVRAGYSFLTELGEFLPYVQWDYYRNPETIAKKSLGGDNEAGLSDDGSFNKQTLGLVYRPVPVAALKLDASNHAQKIDGKNTNYTELRFSYSYIWSL